MPISRAFFPHQCWTRFAQGSSRSIFKACWSRGTSWNPKLKLAVCRFIQLQLNWRSVRSNCSIVRTPVIGAVTAVLESSQVRATTSSLSPSSSHNASSDAGACPAARYRHCVCLNCRATHCPLLTIGMSVVFQNFRVFSLIMLIPPRLL